jgi:hypothetical protein
MEAVFVTRVGVYETYNPGALVRILAYPSEEHNAGNRHWQVLWEVCHGRHSQA